MLDAVILLAALGRDDPGNVELQPVQVEPAAAPRDFGDQLRTQIVYVELRGLLGVLAPFRCTCWTAIAIIVLLAVSRCARRMPSATSLAGRNLELNPRLRPGPGKKEDMMTVARELAEFLARSSPSDLPLQAVEHAAMLIASTLASAAFGAGLESAGIIRDLARERGGRPDASLWFHPGPKLPVADAAQVNAVASDAAASDDSDLRNIVHAGTTLVATTLAAAERTGAGGEDVLAAIVLGYEAAGRIGEAITPGFRTRGFHGCLIAIFAGAVAAGRLLDLEAAPMAQAIALSATSVGGLATAANTSVAREYHAGLAAMLGVQAALAAQRGYQAEESILDTHYGFFEVYGGVEGAAAGASLIRDLGQSWDIVTDMAIKLVPGGHPHHALAEAAANAAR
ncbi:MAG TPA: MmgE/PrpD family protein, partial [Stellaceae bacterium]|nr:MmgE/PrpD family protein [Stellaceae bacterium]